MCGDNNEKRRNIKDNRNADDYYNEGKYEDALEYYLKVARRNLDDDHIIKLSDCFIDQDLYVEAIEVLLPIAKKGNDVAEFYLSGCYGEINF